MGRSFGGKPWGIGFDSFASFKRFTDVTVWSEKLQKDSGESVFKGTPYPLAQITVRSLSSQNVPYFNLI